MSKIVSQFDSGSISVIDDSDWSAMKLAIRPDREGSDEYMWFHFLATGARRIDCTYTIANAGGSRYARGWKDYRIVASYDRDEWFRIPTTYDGTALTWSHTPERDRVWYAYHTPYTESRRFDLLDRCAASPQARIESLGSTLDGRDITLVQVGEPGENKKACWILARQHPGESQSEFAAEYLLDRMLDSADPVSRELLKRAVFYVVPNMNPDGSVRGFHRYNAAFVDINRAWSNTTPEKSPEIWFVRERMRETGVDFCFDIHGDESHHYVWPVRTTGIPSLTEKQTRVREQFEAALLKATPDYVPDLPKPSYDQAPGKDPLNMGISWTAENFGGLSFIVELPFLDNEFAPDPEYGWSAHRSGLFGAACLDALYAVVDDL
jgi:murein tripeptide amidase MpaA